MDFLSIILVALVILWVIAAVIYLIRHRGTGCCGTGSGCSGCCAKCGGCHQDNPKGQRDTKFPEKDNKS
jgi:hypothetical protein